MKWWLKKQFLRLKLYAAENFQEEAESLVIWYAVFYAAGIGFYLSCPWELPIWLVVTYLEAVLVLLYIYRRKYGIFKLLTYAAVFMLGLCLAKADALYRLNKIEKQVPKISYLKGQIKDIHQGINLRKSLLLTGVDNFEEDLKGDFKISVKSNAEWLENGKCIELIAQMPSSYSPNPLSNYNTERTNFYKGISASGYAISPLFEATCDEEPKTMGKWINSWRDKIKSFIKKHTDKNQAGVIEALTIGNKTDISEELSADYRTAGLAHLLAISGMHMGLIALLVFLLMRLLFLPFGGGYRDWRKPAAVISIAMTFLYFLISGQSVSCIRAFVMTSFVLLAVFINRRAISQRLWALAVLIVATLNPSVVLSPGFLMSFAAVLGIIAFYEKNAAKLRKWYASSHLSGKIGAYFAGIIITDLVASLMTLPYSMYYFNQISVYTTLGNVLAGPIIAFWVMPALLLFLISMLFGGSVCVIKILASGVQLINQIAAWVSSLPGAQSGEGIMIMPNWGIFLITIGLLWLCIWQQKWRIWGTAFIVIGLGSIWTVPTPDFVFDKGGTTYACRLDDGKLHPTPWHKNKFLNTMWTRQTNFDVNTTNGMICDKNKCICQQQIEFTKGLLKYNGKEILLKDSGYINLKHGVVYKKNIINRIWNKS